LNKLGEIKGITSGIKVEYGTQELGTLRGERKKIEISWRKWALKRILKEKRGTGPRIPGGKKKKK